MPRVKKVKIDYKDAAEYVCGFFRHQIMIVIIYPTKENIKRRRIFDLYYNEEKGTVDNEEEATIFWGGEEAKEHLKLFCKKISGYESPRIAYLM
jgi:hypothetical protein